MAFSEKDPKNVHVFGSVFYLIQSQSYEDSVQSRHEYFIKSSTNSTCGRDGNLDLIRSSWIPKFSLDW